jgi:hypothetical protein
MGAVVFRKGTTGRSGQTLKGSQSPGEAQAGDLRRTGGGGGTETLEGQPSGKAGEGSSNQQDDTSAVSNLWRTGQPHERRRALR